MAARPRRGQCRGSKDSVSFKDLGCPAATRKILKCVFFLAGFLQRAADDIRLHFPRHHQDPVDVTKDDVTRAQANSLDFERYMVGNDLSPSPLILSIATVAEHGKIDRENATCVAAHPGEHGARGTARPSRG